MKYLATILFSFLVLGVEAQQFNTVAVKLEMLYTTADSLYDLQEMALMSENTSALEEIELEIMRFNAVALNEVKEIIYDYGWLGKSEIGKKANKAIFYLIQNAGDTADHLLFYPQLEISVKMQESDPADMARMKDLILVEAGKSQLYGTQYHFVEGEKVYYDITSPNEVNKRRKKVGLKKLK